MCVCVCMYVCMYVGIKGPNIVIGPCAMSEDIK